MQPDAPAAGFSIRELSLAELLPGAPLRPRFEAIHERGWLRHGIGRWLSLLDPVAAWPVLVLGAQDDADASPAGLCGAIVGVWAPAPIARFDDLLERGCPGAHPDGRPWLGDDRPAGGFWHFVAVTRDPASPHRVADPLLEAALAFVAARPGHAGARALSPLGGLDAVWAACCDDSSDGADAPDPAFVRRCLLELCDAEGKGHFPITWLHPARGARLEAVLHRSRRDERRSCAVTLRFAYDLDPAVRAAQAADWRAFLAARGAAVASGAATPAALPARFWAPAPPPPCLATTDWGG